MASLTMDLTGEHAGHRVEGQVYKIYKYNQIIDFDCTIFRDSLQVYRISDGISGSRTYQLVDGEDYTVDDTQIDDTAISRAKLIDNKFDKELIRGIHLLKGVDVGDSFTVSINYQKLYPNQVRTAYLHKEQLNVTPELILDMLQQLERLNILSNDVIDISSIVTGGTTIYTLDESYKDSNNDVENEEHKIAVVNGKYLIHPKGGSFYRDSVVVKHPSSGTTLQEGKDYVIVGLNHAKTKSTSSEVPVYDFIMVTAPITDFVEISYHAFGGESTIDNYTAIFNCLQSIIHYLNRAEFLSEGTIGSTATITSIFERIDLLEDQMRRLQGQPAYGDITTGKSIIQKYFAETQGLHWFTIASLNKIEGINIKPCTADTFMFRFQTEQSHIQFTAAVSVDINNLSNDRLNVSTIAENYPRGYSPFTDYSHIDDIIRPQIRLVWKDEPQISGAYLQIGFELTHMLEETVQIEDLSGHESCWKLVDEIKGVTTPMDDNFLLPNGTSTWSSILPVCLQEHMLVPYKKGHLIWSGAIEMNDTSGWYHHVFNDLYLNPITDIRKFTKLRVDIEEQDGLQFPIDISFNSGSEHLKGHASFTYQDQPVYINAEMWKENNNIIIRLNWEVLAGTGSNALSIRDMVIYL